MKTIIAATDFTPSSVNACRYAAMLAEKLDCRLTLFNLFEAPVVHSNIGLYGVSMNTSKQQSLKKTEKLIGDLQAEFPKVKMNFFVSHGSFKQELEEFTAKHLVEAAVMGLKTKDRLSRFIYGSHGVDIAGKIKTPVIIVPESYTRHKLSKMMLAVDNNEKLYRSSLIGIERLVKKLKLQVRLLHVRTELELFKPMQQEVKLNGHFLPVVIKEAKDVAEGTKKFCRENEIDMVTVLSKSHSALHNLFLENHTKKIAFAAKVPVMAIHE